MGCTQSKIENEEAVARCKDRKQFMKEAVSARNAFAAAHSAYTMSLKNTGAALSDYAHGEVQNPQHIPLNHHHISEALPLPPSPAPPPPMDRLVPPPPPPEPFERIQRATSMPAINLSERKEKESNRVAAATTIMEEDNEEEVENSQEKLITRKRSSGRNRSAASSAVGNGVGGVDHQFAAVDNNGAMQQQNSAWDYFFSSMENMPGPTLEVKEEKELIEEKVFDEMPKRVEEEEKAPAEAEMEPPVMEEEKRKVVESPPPPPPESDVMTGRNLKKGKVGGGVGGMVEKRGGKGGANLLQVFVELDDLFLKAYESAHEVSKMLEATRLHYHSNFADNRGISLVEDWFLVLVNGILHEFVKNK